MNTKPLVEVHAHTAALGGDETALALLLLGARNLLLGHDLALGRADLDLLALGRLVLDIDSLGTGLDELDVLLDIGSGLAEILRLVAGHAGGLAGSRRSVPTGSSRRHARAWCGSPGHASWPPE